MVDTWAPTPVNPGMHRGCCLGTHGVSTYPDITGLGGLSGHD